MITSGLVYLACFLLDILFNPNEGHIELEEQSFIENCLLFVVYCLLCIFILGKVSTHAWKISTFSATRLCIKSYVPHVVRVRKTCRCDHRVERHSCNKLGAFIKTCGCGLEG